MPPPRADTAVLAAGALLAVAATAVAPAARAASAAALDLALVASSNGHTWLVVTRTPPNQGLELRHLARGAAGPWYGPVMPLAGQPRAIAAWDDTLWLVYEATGGAGEPGRKTLTLQVRHQPALGGWYFDPPDRLRALASLDGRGRLVDFAAAPGGPIALLAPHDWVEAGVVREGGDPAGQSELREPELVQLRGREWVPLPLPGDFKPARSCRMSVAGADGRGLVILNEASGARLTTAWWREPDGGWTRQGLGFALAGVVSTTRVGPNVAIVTEGRPSGEVSISYLRPTKLLELASIPIPTGPWAIAGMTDGLRLMERGPQGDLRVRLIDPVSGQPGPRQALVPQPLMAARILHVPFLLALAITAVMVVLLWRPHGRGAEVALPVSLAVVSPLPRLTAVAIDLAASAAVTLVVLRCPLPDLARMPLWTTDLGAAWPFLLTAGVTVLHSTAAELIWQRSLGKAFVGARVAKLDGSRPPATAILLRNAFKAIVLLIPVLAVFALLNPHLQGLGDSIARTLVVRRSQARAGDGDSGR